MDRRLRLDCRITVICLRVPLKCVSSIHLETILLNTSPGYCNTTCSRQWTPRHSAIRLGHSWSPCRTRDRQETRYHRTRGRYEDGNRKVQRRMSRHCHAVCGRVATDRRTHGSLDRFRQRLQDTQYLVHGECLVGFRRVVQERCRLSWTEGHAVLHGLPDTIIEFRGRSELQGCERPSQ